MDVEKISSRKQEEKISELNESKQGQGNGLVDKAKDCCANEGAGVQIPKTNVLVRQGGHLLGHSCLGETKTWYPQGRLTS